MAGVGLTSYNAFDDMVTNALVEYLEEKSSRDGRPFAAVAGFMMPHCPFFAPEELFDYYYDKVDVPMPTASELERQPQAVKDMKKLRDIDEPLTERQIRVARAAYYGMCELFDASVGKGAGQARRDRPRARHPRRLHDRPWRGRRRAWDVVEEQLLRGVRRRSLDRATAGRHTQRVREIRSSATRSISRQRSWRRQGRASYPKSPVVPYGPRCRAELTRPVTTRPSASSTE